MPLCYYLATQGTGLLLQLKERSTVVLGGGVLVTVGGWHHLALSVRKMRPAANTYPRREPLGGWEKKGGRRVCAVRLWPRTPHPRP